jgi:hypothetical protein
VVLKMRKTAYVGLSLGTTEVVGTSRDRKRDVIERRGSSDAVQ